MTVSVFIKGRMYDYNAGRFLSVDPFIQSPSSTQSMNPYTYIFNNPLSGTDPSGYVASIVGGLFQGEFVKSHGPEAASNLDPKIAVAAVLAVGVALIDAAEVIESASDLIAPVKAIAKKGGFGNVIKSGLNSAKTALKNGIQKLGKGVDKKTSPEDLKNRADEIHGELDEVAQRFRTTGATRAVDKDGKETIIISSSEKRLSKQQRESLKEGEIEGTSTKKGEHVEVTGIRTAKEKDLTPTDTAASRPICQNCQQNLKENNVNPASPLKAPPKNKKGGKKTSASNTSSGTSTSTGSHIRNDKKHFKNS